MEAVRAWFETRERQGSVCRHLHLDPAGRLICEPFRPLSDTSRPSIPVPTFEAALRLLGAARPAGRNAGCAPAAYPGSPSLGIPHYPAASLGTDSRARAPRTAILTSGPAASLSVPVSRHDASFSGPSVEPRYLTYAQAADWLGVKPKTIRNWVCSGKLRPVYVLGLPRFTPEYLDSIVEARRAAPDQGADGRERQ